MANNVDSIQYIQIGENSHPIDAVSVGGKTAQQIGDLVTSISSNSTDTEYPSAKCVSDVFADNELTIITHLSNTLTSVDQHISQHTTEISYALLENEAVMATSLAEALIENESVLIEAYRELNEKVDTMW